MGIPRLLFPLLTLLVPALAGAATPASASKPAAPGFQKVLIVVLENADYADAVRQPDLAAFAARGAEMDGFHGETHPSQPNYLALVSGRTLGVTSDKSFDLEGSHIADLLDANHRSWKAYLEDYPGACFAGEKSGQYVRKHNPWISFANVRNDPARCSRLVPAAELARDARAGKLPDFSLYIPDMRNDGHDTNVDYAGKWLTREFLPALGTLPEDLLVVVTFDESASSSGGNRIYTAMVGDGIRPGTRSGKYYNHYNLLRTIENRFRLGTLKAGDEKAAAIDDVWG